MNNKNLYLLPTDKPSRLGYIWESENYHIFTNGENPNNIADNLACYRNIYITSDEEIKEGDWYLDTFNTQRIKADQFSDHKHYGSACKKIILTTDTQLIKDDVQSIPDEFLEWFVKNTSCEEVELKKGFEDGSSYGYNFLDYKIIIPKEELKKYPIGGYAPGYYMCNCSTCKTQFQGDKRAVQCEPCAIKMAKEEPKQRLEKYSERFDNKDNELVEGVFNPENWGRRLVEDKQETLEEAGDRELSYINKVCSENIDFVTGFRLAMVLGAKWQMERSYSEEHVIELLQKALTHKDDGEIGSLVTAQGEIRPANFFSWFERFKKK